MTNLTQEQTFLAFNLLSAVARIHKRLDCLALIPRVLLRREKEKKKERKERGRKRKNKIDGEKERERG